YTPTGRSIQKSYAEGYDEYENDIAHRVKKGELIYSDSIHFAASLRYTTPGGQTVYGGGGIMPDVFIPLDTVDVSRFYTEVNGRGQIVQYAYDYLDRNRKTITDKYKNFEAFNKEFSITDEEYKSFISYV